jgi:WD40 repeat protein
VSTLVDIAAPASPYKGLAPFDDSELDAFLFFGRAKETEVVSANLLASRLTLLYGPSGVGKSSLLRAGVVRALRAEPGPCPAVVYYASWAGDPLTGLEEAARAAVTRALGREPADAPGELADKLAAWSAELGAEVCLLLDQLEELFLYHPAAEGAGGFVALLPGLVGRPGLRVNVLLGIRDDALSQLDVFKGRLPGLFANSLRLDHLDREAGRGAILGPLECYASLVGPEARVGIEPELVEAVLDEVAAGRIEAGRARRRSAPSAGPSVSRIETPYLQLVMQRIWEIERERGSTDLRLETFRDLGGAQRIVEDHLERALRALTAAEQDAAANVFGHLVTPSGTKIAHGVSDLASYAEIGERELEPVLRALAGLRILRPLSRNGGGGPRYEIYHDVLASAVLDWRTRHEAERVLERERRAARVRNRRFALAALAALVALAIVSAIAVYALIQRSDARANAREARAGELAARAESGLAVDPLRSLDLAKRAAEMVREGSAEDVLRRALVESHVRLDLLAGRGPTNAAAYSPDGARVVTASDDGNARIFRTSDGRQIAALGHGASLSDAAFSENGRLLATAARDGTVRLWTPRGRPLRALQTAGGVLDLAWSSDSRVLAATSEPGRLYAWIGGDPAPRVFRESEPAPRVAISPDGRYAATGGADRFARVYDLNSADNSPLYELRHGGTVLSLAFGPRKELLVTGSADSTVRTWDLRRGKRGLTLTGHQGPVVDVAVSAGGEFVGSASADGSARVWDITRPPRDSLVAVVGHTNLLSDVAFSRDGLFVVTSGRDAVARVWKTDGGNLQGVLRGQGSAIRGASFDPAGTNVLTYAENGSVRIWDPGIDPELPPRGRHRGPIETLDLVPGLALTTSDDKTARIWRLDRQGQLALRHRAPVNDAAFSRDGRLVVTASDDRTARVWLTTGALRETLRHPAPVNAAAFSPDSEFVATAGNDGFVRLWRSRDGQREALLRHARAVDRVAFSPDGELLAAGARGGALRIWRVGEESPEHALSAHQGPISAIAFSPDGRLLVTAGADRVAKLWAVDSGELVQTMRGHRDAVTSATFSSDGRFLATASVDHDVRLWDGRTGALRRTLPAHQAIVSDARFSDDGRWLVTAGPGAARIWDVGNGRLLVTLRGHDGIITAAGFAPGRDTVVTVGADGTIRRYSCALCADVPRLLEMAEARLRRVPAPRPPN